MKKVLITGITGQDGSYLAELLLEKGYEVHGLVKRTSTGINLLNIDNIKDNIIFHYGDLTDSANLKSIISSINPEEVYNLAAQSHVGVSFEVPTATSYVNAIGTLNLLESIRTTDKNCKFYQASTSELFGKVQQIPQKENTPFYPRSPYAVAKLYAYWITVNYRESYSLYTCNGILFNHESPRRGPEFVTRKIVIGLISNHLGLQGPVKLGNLNALRDWGHAKDYVKAMWSMMQKDKPDDYIIATGEQHSVKDFCTEVAHFLNFDIEWSGSEENEIGINSKTGKVIIEVSKDFYRPAEVNTLLGDPTKAITELNWVREYNFKDLVTDMCINEMKRIDN